MSREKQKITMWKYPYTVGDGIKNIGEYGISSALSHDWERTKEAMESRLEKVVMGVIGGVAICVTIPLAAYTMCRFAKMMSKEQRKKLANEGFYQEVYDNKNQIKRY